MRNGGVKIAASGLILLLGSVLPLAAQEKSSSIKKTKGVRPGIAWYGVLADGLAEADRTGKAILFVSAAPNCTGVSGIW